MNGNHQISHTIEIDAPVAHVWAVIADQSVLQDWVPVVSEVLDVDGAGVGMTRVCAVDFQGRRGTMTERCVEYLPNHRAGYVVVDDSLGFNRILSDYGFTLTLDPRPGTRTALRIDTYYTPRNPAAAVLNSLMLRRRFRRTVAQIAGGLKTFSEQARPTNRV